MGNGKISTWLEEELALKLSHRGQVLGWDVWVGGGSSITSLCLTLQTQLPQQKLQLQEAYVCKEKNVAVLEHQLLEVEVRGSA